VRYAIGLEDRQSFQGLEKYTGGMYAKPLIRSMRASDELGGRAASHVDLENGIGIVQIGNDQVEFREVIHQVRFQFTPAREKAGQATGLDRLHPVSKPGLDGQLDDMRVAENLEMNSGKLFP
jgi:hypothetical protein